MNREINRIENVYEVTKRLLGMIEPYGSTHVDEVRFANLEQTIEVTEMLINDIIMVARHQDRHEHSIAQAGKEADQFITRLKERLNS